MIAYNVRKKGTMDWFTIESGNGAISALIRAEQIYWGTPGIGMVLEMETEDPEGKLVDYEVTFLDSENFTVRVMGEE